MVLCIYSCIYLEMWTLLINLSYASCCTCTQTDSTSFFSPSSLLHEGQVCMVQFLACRNIQSNVTGLTSVYTHSCLLSSEHRQWKAAPSAPAFLTLDWPVFHVLYLQMEQLGWCWTWSYLYPLSIYRPVFYCKDKVINKRVPCMGHFTPYSFWIIKSFMATNKRKGMFHSLEILQCKP